jgi:hypothetical protein
MTVAGATSAGLSSRQKAARVWATAAALMLTALGPLILLAGPALYRLGWLDLETAMWGLADVAKSTSVVAGVAALGLILLHVVQPPRRGVIIGIAALTLALLTGMRIFAVQLQRDSLPPIWDAQTSWADPVTFSAATLAERAEAGAPAVGDGTDPAGEGRWADLTVAGAQAEVFELAPLTVDVPPEQAKQAVAEAMLRAGMKIRPDHCSWPTALRNANCDVASQSSVEAIYRSPWYGLVSDVVVRIRPSPDGGSVMDARSTSRVAAPDMGANARRVETLMGDVAFALRGAGG